MNPLDEIVLSPAPGLAEECEPIDKIDDEIRALAKRMLRDMYAADGCGLAAPQVGVAKQIVVIDVDWSGKGSKKNPYVLINPKVITADGPERTTGEGCLSFPGITVEVKRPATWWCRRRTSTATSCSTRRRTTSSPCACSTRSTTCTA